jgi:uncharacterized membrane protein YdjX (TVP38/TMEM64 family)
MARREPKSNSLWKPFALLLFVFVMIVAAKVFHFGDEIKIVQEWVRSLGFWGPAVFVLIYIIVVIAALPGTALTLMSGAMFGSVTGIISSSLGATLGAGASFLIARYFARESVAKWVSKHKKFKKIDDLTATRGPVIVAFTRLVPLFPFNVFNYAFGLTRVGFWPYLFWSWLCMLPVTILCVVGVGAFTKTLSEGTVPWPMVAILVIVFIIIVFAVRAAKKQLKS